MDIRVRRAVPTDAETAVLWVLSGNERARAFYARLGWLPDGATGKCEVPGAALSRLRLRKHLR